MRETVSVMPFTLAEQHYALLLEPIITIVPAVEISPIVDHTSWLQGTLNLHGDIIPVVSLASLLTLPEQPVALTDFYIIATVYANKIAFRVNSVATIIRCSLSENTEHASSLQCVKQKDNSLALLIDLEKLVTRETISHITPLVYRGLA